MLSQKGLLKNLGRKKVLRSVYTKLATASKNNTNSQKKGKPWPRANNHPIFSLSLSLPHLMTFHEGCCYSPGRRRRGGGGGETKRPPPPPSLLLPFYFLSGKGPCRLQFLSPCGSLTASPEITRITLSRFVTYVTTFFLIRYVRTIKKHFMVTVVVVVVVVV